MFLRFGFLLITVLFLHLCSPYSMNYNDTKCHDTTRHDTTWLFMTLIKWHWIIRRIFLTYLNTTHNTTHNTTRNTTHLNMTRNTTHYLTYLTHDRVLPVAAHHLSAISNASLPCWGQCDWVVLLSGLRHLPILATIRLQSLPVHHVRGTPFCGQDHEVRKREGQTNEPQWSFRESDPCILSRELAVDVGRSACLSLYIVLSVRNHFAQ